MEFLLYLPIVYSIYKKITLCSYMQFLFTLKLKKIQWKYILFKEIILKRVHLIEDLKSAHSNL